MKKISVLLGLIICLTGKAQFLPITGDSDLDKSLIELNNDVKNDIISFTNDVAATFGLPKPKIETLLNIHHMQPADVVMALEIAQITTQPIENVASVFDKNKSKGWGVIAKEMGIKQGSKEFHQLKDNAKGKSKGMKGKGKNKEEGKGQGNGKGNGNNKGKGKK